MAEQWSPRQLAEKIRRQDPDIILLDVREPGERDLVAIEPSCHIPLNELPRRHRELPRSKTIVVYCHHGVRSSIVCGYLEALGFPRVANLRGGIHAWSLEVDPTLPQYG